MSKTHPLVTAYEGYDIWTEIRNMNVVIEKGCDHSPMITAVVWQHPEADHVVWPLKLPFGTYISIT